VKPPRSLRATIIVAAALLLGGLTAAMRAVTHEISEEMAAALATQRVHIEKVSQIERLARATHIEMVERWLLPFAERARMGQSLEDRVAEVRRSTDDFARMRSIGPEESEKVARLLVAVAIWSNRVDQAVVASDGPSATSELRRYLDDIDRCANGLIEVASRAGSSTDRRVVVLRGRQATVQIVFVLVTLAILGLAVASSQGKARADERYRLAEEARHVQAREAQLRAQFFASMSHELRTPLVAIQGFAQTMSERRGLDAPTRDAARRIGREAQDLLAIINNILDASKLEAGHVKLHLEPIALGDVFERCLQRCEGLVVARHIEVVCETPPDLPRVRGDFVKLQQIFTNLLANAIKFTEKGRVTLRAWSSGRTVQVAVEDTGVGIPPEALDRIWKPFEQASEGVARRFGGTGLGLSIAHGLCELLGGKIEVRSTVGVGSVFTVTLPRAASESEQLAS
jgi:signal transduction histidine kinase